MNDKSNILGSLMPIRQPPNRQDKNNGKENTTTVHAFAPHHNPNQSMDLRNTNRQTTNPNQQQRPTSGASSSLGTISECGGGSSGRQHKLKQRFTVIRKLGKGTYGKVQLAINKETGQEVAIKTIKKTKIENDQDLQRVRREIQIMSSIEHPHIIHIYEVFENKDKIVLVMQYAPGGELYEYVSQSKLLDDCEARRLFRQIATAIYYCHQNKICHRDLKLENILLDEKNNAKLADFGLSNVFDKRRQLKTFCGSPLYASPEIVQGSPYEGPEVDCWSLGVLLYTLVYGAMPFDGSNFKRLVKQISEGSYYEPKQRSQASPLIRRLLCADPTKRANILDICSDAWVNGCASIGGSPRISSDGSSPPTANIGQQQQTQTHNSLLKVAQDMANLTPVRLDILLALTPTSPATQQPPADPLGRLPFGQQSENNNNWANRAPPSQLALDPSSVMEVDETRATSPVASYIVRDLTEPSVVKQPEQGVDEQVGSDQEAEREQEDMAEVSVNQIQSEQEVDVQQQQETEQSGQPVMMLEGDEPQLAKEEEPQQQQVTTKADDAQADVKMDKEDHSITVEASGGITSTAAEEERADKLETDEDEKAAKEVVETIKGESEKISEIQADEEVKMEVDTHQQPNVESVADKPPADNVALIVDQNKEATTTSGQTGEDEPADQAAQTQATSGVAGSGEEPAADEKAAAGEKPKKVKKKIIVVKKRKKVVKKDPVSEQTTADSQQEKDDKSRSDKEISPKTGEIGEKDHMNETSDGGGKQPAVGNQSKPTKGPGKVRIPNTFQADDGNGNDNQTTQQTPTPKAPEGRRQSALVADVSQKLFQQLDQSGGNSNSAQVIKSDQPQLSSVKVSDKRSEFERRASQASTQQPHVSSGKGSQQQTSEIKMEEEADKHEPKRIDSLLESLNILNTIGQTIVEPVTGKQEPLEVSCLEALLRPIQVKEPSESQTPTAGSLAAAAAYQQADMMKKQLTERLDKLGGGGGEDTSSGQDRKSPSLLDAAMRDDRSDSVETIKAEALESPNVEQKSVRSSFNIDLGPREAEAVATDTTTGLSHTTTGVAGENQSNKQQQKSTRMGSNSQMTTLPGPAPIARSYKKVTFTRDGACITETGKIYSAQADDGTVRRIERKSKITHYPASDDPMSTDRVRETEETEEEILYGDDGSRMWQESFQTSAQQQTAASRGRRPFEKLIMPSTDFLATDLDDDFTSSPMRYSQPFSAPSRQQQSQQIGRTDSGSSCSSGSTDVFDDIFDTWTGAISMFNQNHNFMARQNSLMSRAFGVDPLLPPLGQSIFSPSSHHRRSHSRNQRSSKDRVSSSLAGTPRCGSVEPQLMSSASGGRPGGGGVHRRRHRRDWMQSGQDGGGFGGGARYERVDEGGYESDAPMERPGSATLGSARGTFGSSNLFQAAPEARNYRHSRQLDGPFESFFDRQEEPIFARKVDPFSSFGDDIIRNIQQEHLSLKQRLAQQHKQMWKGSTPSLFTTSAASTDSPQTHRGGDHQAQQARYSRQEEGLWQSLRPQESLDGFYQHPLRPKSSSGSQSSSVQQQQSSPWQHRLPPKQQQQQVLEQQNLGQSQSSSSFLRQSVALDAAPTRRNTANLPDHRQLPPRQQFQPMRRSISKTSLVTSQLANVQLGPSNSSSSANQQQTQTANFIELKRTASSSEQQQQQLESRVTSSRLISRSGSSSAFWDTQVSPLTSQSFGDAQDSSDRHNRQRNIDPTSMQQKQQPEDNVDSRVQSWLQESAGNLSSSSGFKSSVSDTMHSNKSDPFVNLYGSQQKQAQSAGLLPPPSKAPSSSRAVSEHTQSQQVNHSTSSTILVSSSSKHSMTDSSEHGSQARHEQHVHQMQREQVAATGDGGQLSKASSSTKVSKATFTLRQKSPIMDPDLQLITEVDNCFTTSAVRSQQVISQQHHEQRQQVSNSSSYSRVSAPMTAPISSTRMVDDPLHWINHQTTESSSSRLFGGVDDLDVDSLSGGGSGGDLESRSSSSLLNQLRSRGYRSMINQRMVGEQQQQQQQSSVVESSSRVITSSSSSTSGTRIVQQKQQVFTSSSSTHQESSIQGGVDEDQDRSQQTRNSNDNDDPPDLNLLQKSKVAPPSEKVGEEQVGVGQANQVSGGQLSQVGEAVSRNEQATENGKIAAGKNEENEGEDGDDDDDEDEDVKEAKVNIKAYLDRMKETELFLKSMQQEEENMERQRQQLFLFNNLMLSTKLNGIHRMNQRPASLMMDDMPTFTSATLETNNERPQPPVTGLRSAPIRSSFNYNNLGGMMAETQQLVDNNGYIPSSATTLAFEPTYTIPPASYHTSANNINTCYLGRARISIEPLNLGLNTGLEPTPTASCIRPLTTNNHLYNSKDPLEPIQAFCGSMHSATESTTTCFDPPRWRRSKSQHSDQFNDYMSNKRQPMSASIGGGDSSCSGPDATANAYFPSSSSRNRRSLSQLRYPSSNRYHGHGGQSSVKSEYSSSFGNPHHISSVATERVESPVDWADSGLMKGDVTDDSDDGMSSYRASSYVPKVVPQGMPSRGRSYQRRSFKLEPNSWSSSNDIKATPTRNRYESPFSDRIDTKRERRISLQTTSNRANNERDQRDWATTRDSSPSAITYRRRSLNVADSVAANDSAKPFSGENSRLSELELRIQANKKRREELLSGRQLSPKPSDDRQSNKRTQQQQEQQTTMTSDDKLSNEQSSGKIREVSPATSVSPRSSKQFSRPSRLESMEARIKRKSYYVRMGDCSPERTKWSQSTTSGSRVGGASGSNYDSSYNLVGSSLSKRRDSSSALAANCNSYGNKNSYSRPNRVEGSSNNGIVSSSNGNDDNGNKSLLPVE